MGAAANGAARTLAFYGKGGIGKTTVSANISVAFAQSGSRVLHIGCDPKGDSCYQLLGRRSPRTVMGLLRENPAARLQREDFMFRGACGIDCIESGGPEAGVGCAGRGIAKTLDILKETRVLDDGYGTVIFDVLGDLVCGGFAGAMRLGFAREVYVVLSGEVLALWAANNISHAVARYSRNGVRLGGLIPNLRGVENEEAVLARFAQTLGARLMPPVARDPVFAQAERAARPLLDYAPESAAAARVRSLFEAISRSVPVDCSIPTPLNEGAFEGFIADVRRAEFV